MARAMSISRPSSSPLELRAASPEDGPSRLLARIPANRHSELGTRAQPETSPDGRWLVLPLRDGETTNLWAISTADGTLRQLTSYSRTVYIGRRVSWSPDGRSVYAAVGEPEADIVLLEGLQ